MVIFCNWKGKKHYGPQEDTDINTTRIYRHPALPFLELKTGAEERYAVRPHSHEELSVGFVEQGSSRIICEHLQFRLNIHDAILIPPHVVHLCKPEDPDNYRFQMLFLDAGWVKNTFNTDPFALAPATTGLSQQDRDAKTALFLSLASGNRTYDALKLEEETILFIARLPGLLNAGPAVPDSEPAGPAIQQAKSLLDNRFIEDIRLETLETACGLSRFALVRRFRAAFGLTPHAYLINKRINLARQLLSGKETIADIAAHCGFFDQSHFVKTFSAYTGMTPAAFREKS